MTHDLQHHVHLAVRRGSIVGRRDFLRSLSAFGLAGAWSWADVVSARAVELRKEGRACILLWMQGGPSQFETFSPKPGHGNGGPTRAISTSVSGIEVAEHFPQLARQMQHVALVRSMTSKEGSHPRASFLMHTGYLPTASVQYPALGAVAAQQLADPASDLPNFVRIGSRLRNSGNGGLLGVAYDAFEMARAGGLPENAAPNVDGDRHARRLALRDKLDGLGGRLPEERSRDQKSLYQRTARMVGSRRMTAFELDREPQKVREAYGEGDFAAGCLLARRLVESGVTFVEVSAGNWDTHQDNFEQIQTLAGQVDRPTAQLIADLAARGMLDKTLVVWMGGVRPYTPDQCSRRPRPLSQGVQPGAGRRRRARRPGVGAHRRRRDRGERPPGDGARPIPVAVPRAGNRRRRGEHHVGWPADQGGRQGEPGPRAVRLSDMPLVRTADPTVGPAVRTNGLSWGLSASSCVRGAALATNGLAH